MSADDEAVTVFDVNAVVARHDRRDIDGDLVDFLGAAVKRLDEHVVVPVRVDFAHFKRKICICHQALEMIDAVVLAIRVKRCNLFQQFIILFRARLRLVELCLELFLLRFQVLRAVQELLRLDVQQAHSAAEQIVAVLDLVDVTLPLCHRRQMVDGVARAGIVR